MPRHCANPKCSNEFPAYGKRLYCSQTCRWSMRYVGTHVVSDEPAIHIVIPDTQAKPGVPTEHLGWINQYVLENYADRENVKAIHLGDHWDMPSLSSYDKGKRGMEGRRVKKDLKAGNKAFAKLSAGWSDRMECHFLFGNHEHRLTRATEEDAQLDGLLSLDDMETPGWRRHGFLEVLELDGVHYSHYFANPSTGRPYGGQSIDTRLKNVGYSFTMGHQQGLHQGMRSLTNGKRIRGMVAGSCYLHDEEYLGPQGNFVWRGILVCHQVEAGDYDVMEVSLDYLSRRYAGKRLAELPLAA